MHIPVIASPNRVEGIVLPAGTQQSINCNKYYYPLIYIVTSAQTKSVVRLVTLSRYKEIFLYNT